MKNRDSWKPSKYVYRKGKLRASRDRSEVGAGSRLAADLVAGLYGTYVPQYARGKLVDLGCGKVPLFEAYGGQVTENTCVDWPFSRHQNRYSDVVCDLNRPLPFPDGAFDTIILSDVLEHIPEPEKLWQEMHRIASVRGKLIMNVPFYYPLHEQPHDYYRYSEHALRRFARQAGFTVLVLKPVGGSLEIMVDMLAKHLQFIPLIGRPLCLALQHSAYAFIRTRVGSRLSERTAQSLPFGYFLVAEKE